MTDLTLELEDTFKEESEPRENESDLEDVLIADLSGSVIQPTDWTTATIVDQIEKGRILLNPNFQRRDAWRVEFKSRFIESVVLGFPIPQLVLAESQTERGKYLVIDGKQRLLSLMQFAGKSDGVFDQMKLKGLEILKQFNGKTFEQIRDFSDGKDLLDDFDTRSIRTVIIRHWKHEDVLYHIFLRLNTGSTPLSPQELRNALHPGSFAEFIDSYSTESPSLKKILKNKKPDFRMRDAELLLRYYAFSNFLPNYAGSMKSFLDDTTKNLNKRWTDSEEEIKKQAEEFEKSVKLVYEIFGEKDAFHKWKSGSFTDVFNRAVFDVVLFYFRAENVRKIAKNKPVEVKDAFMALSRDNVAFTESLETTTKSLSATSLRLSLWGEALQNALGEPLKIPRLKGNRIIS